MSTQKLADAPIQVKHLNTSPDFFIVTAHILGKYLTKFLFCRCINEGGPAHAKRFTFSVRVNTSDKGWTDECIGDPMPSVKKAKDSAAVLLLELLNKWYA